MCEHACGHRGGTGGLDFINTRRACSGNKGFFLLGNEKGKRIYGGRDIVSTTPPTHT